MAEKAKTKKTSRTRIGKKPGYPGSKGPGNGQPAYRFKQAGPGRGHYSIEGESRLEREARHGQEMRALYHEFANNELLAVDTRMKAATHLLDRTEGLPVQKVMMAETDPITMMSDAELVADAKRQADMIANFEAQRQADAEKPA